MFETLFKLVNNNKVVLGIVIAVILVIVVYCNVFKSKFSGNLVNPAAALNKVQPRSFPSLKSTGLAPPVVPEEIGLSQRYPQGVGVGMTNADSNSFKPGHPGPLLTDYTIPESYGESSLTDPTGRFGANQGARILRIVSTGDQLNFKPSDETEKDNFSVAYSCRPGLVNEEPACSIDYSDSFVPEQNLTITTSPGQESNLCNCEQTYPNVVKYGDFCITEGDIPYGQVVGGKVNPRLVSRWESYTGDYSRKEALRPVDGLLYPNLSVLVN